MLKPPVMKSNSFSPPEISKWKTFKFYKWNLLNETFTFVFNNNDVWGRSQIGFLLVYYTTKHKKTVTYLKVQLYIDHKKRANVSFKLHSMETR